MMIMIIIYTIVRSIVSIITITSTPETHHLRHGPLLQQDGHHRTAGEEPGRRHTAAMIMMIVIVIVIVTVTVLVICMIAIVMVMLICLIFYSHIITQYINSMMSVCILLIILLLACQ